MKELFLPYDLAFIAKQKGFKVGCIAWYEPNTRVFNMLGQDHNIFHLTTPSDFIIPAPIYQQVTDWLLKDHNIFISPTHRNSKGNKDFDCLIQFGDNFKFTGYYPTITEVLNEAIKDALKLI